MDWTLSVVASIVLSVVGSILLSLFLATKKRGESR